ncbi:6434_t:CDS:2 [Funneliformis mosseae]|uniref:6434_t:CDS:1 n=1 Tax=Funneliformis mosseae TaxID=27381 RepID=A0A9N8ZM07_FUNMO|nr:6434_t:CDS:2 [Funneliformis mosseae]
MYYDRSLFQILKITMLRRIIPAEKEWFCMRLVGTVKSHIQLGNYFYNPYSKHMEIQLYACKTDISPLPHGQVQIDTISEMTSNLYQTFPSLCTSNHHATLHHVGQ